MAKKYYWLRLKEDFFDDDAIGWIEEQPKGKEYALFYLKLCLKSLKTDGILIRTVGTMLVPYDMKKLSEITKTDFDTVVVAMELLKNIGLVEVLENGEIFLPRLSEMVGSETDKALLMRKKREQVKLSNGNIVTEVLPDCYRCNDGNNVTTELPECSKSVTQRLEIENRDKEIEKRIIVEPAANESFSASSISDRKPIGDFEYQCVDMLIKSCVSVFPNSKVPVTDVEKRKWASEIERMKRLDNRSESDIIEALTYATTDSFWKANIRSTKKFREKFETLIVQCRLKTNAIRTMTSLDKYNQMMRQDYDMDAIERALLGTES